MSDNSGVGNKLPSEMMDLAGVFYKMSGDIHFSDMYAQMPDDCGDGNHSPSETTDLVDDLDMKSGTPLTEFRESFSGDIQISDMYTPMPDDCLVGNQLPSETTDLAGTSITRLEGPFLG